MIRQEGVFVGANKELNSTAYNQEHELLVYGAGRTLAVWNPASAQVVGTLKGHTAEVTCVRWLNSTTLISGSEDTTVKVWCYTPNIEAPVVERFTFTADLKDHSSSVLDIECCGDLFVTSGADSNICIYRDLHLVTKFQVSATFYSLAMNLLSIPHGHILFVGGTNKKLYIYTLVGNDITQQYALEGHEDWIKSIAVKQETEGEYLIATGAQDRHIRLWKLNLDDKIDDSDKDQTKLRLLQNKQYKFSVGATQCSVFFESILMGHEDWISTLIWHPTELTLLSSSADTSIMLWEPDMVSGIWVARIRLGELSIKGASTATGASGGFWSAQWIFKGDTQTILTHGKTGSWRVWRSNGGDFEQVPGVTGPTRAVTDLSWSQHGEHLLTTSLDQTTRLYSQTAAGEWHEFARPQIHGYDMVCVATMNNTKFVSAGDEKILRVFEEPKSVAKMLERVCGIKEGDVESMPQSASLPVLGLSNKAEQEETEQDEDDESAPVNNVLDDLEGPPLEDHLQRHTLWPEVEKLYGHGYEITTLAISPDQKLIASACRSNSVAHAVIRVFQTDNWQPLKPLSAGHELTITRLRFSPNNKYLLAISRDRQLSLWTRESELEFKLHKLQQKAHSRILWDCAWYPQTVSETKFFTASRDKSIKLWQVTETDLENVSSVKLGEAVTAIAVLDRPVDNHVVLAAGLDSGAVFLYKVDETGTFHLLEQFHDAIVPALRVSRLEFRPSQIKIELAAASDDTTTRIYSISL